MALLTDFGTSRAVYLAVIVLTLGLLLWRLRRRPKGELIAARTSRWGTGTAGKARQPFPLARNRAWWLGGTAVAVVVVAGWAVPGITKALRADVPEAATDAIYLPLILYGGVLAITIALAYTLVSQLYTALDDSGINKPWWQGGYRIGWNEIERAELKPSMNGTVLSLRSSRGEVVFGMETFKDPAAALDLVRNNVALERRPNIP